jgi:predicted hydrocarbon binding protein
VQFTGGTDVTVRHAECRALGHPFCLFEYRYK